MFKSLRSVTSLAHLLCPPPLPVINPGYGSAEKFIQATPYIPIGCHASYEYRLPIGDCLSVVADKLQSSCRPFANIATSSRLNSPRKCITIGKLCTAFGNRSATNNRWKLGWKCGGGGGVPVASGCQWSPLFVGCRRSATDLHSCVTRARFIKTWNQ